MKIQFKITFNLRLEKEGFTSAKVMLKQVISFIMAPK